MPRLTIRSGEGNPITHELADETITVGRSPDNNIVLDDPSVSGRHAELRQVGSNYHVKDLGSTNGTRLNGEPISDIGMRPGDRVRFGKVEVCYECDPDEGAQPLPHAEEAAAKTADASAKPADFVNASPFPHRKKKKDPTRTAVLAVAAVAAGGRRVKHGRPLRVQAEWVSGNNPITWCKIILSDDNG